MSIAYNVRILNREQKDKVGTIKGRIPGGDFFKIETTDGEKLTLKSDEFERILCNSPPYNEKVD